MSKNNVKSIPITLAIFLLLTIFSQTYAQVLLWYDDMTNFPTNWTIGGTGGPWIKDSTRYKTEPYSVKCTPDTNYSNNQNNWMQRSINLTGYMSASVVFSIWQNTKSNDYIYFEYLSGGNWITYWARSGNFGGFDMQVMTNIPNTASAIRFRFLSNGSDTAEGVYIDEVYVYGYRYDVGCTQILAPTDTVDSGQVVTPQGGFYNFGDFISTFNVRMRIGSFYSNAQQVSNLPPNNGTTKNFANWTALQRGTHLVRCSTEHPDDINRSNDRAIGYVTVRVRNVSTASILDPTGTVDSGQVVTPRAVIRNYGTTTETFLVFFWIGANYTSTRVLTLASGVACTTEFDPWTALPRGNHTTKCSTALIGDMRPNDNHLTGQVTVRVRDVGVMTIVAPAGYVDSTTTIVPKAKIQNYGTHQENLTVTFRITGLSNFGNWFTSANITNLNPGEQRTIEFSPWQIGKRGSYSTRCSTALVGDQVVNNDWRDSSFIVRVHDVGIVDILSPPASVDSAQTVAVTASVKNYGTEPETFLVQFRVGSFYANSRTLTLNSGELAVVNFDSWIINQTRNTYSYQCSTALINDANPNNNIKTGDVTVNVHDVGVAQINSPLSLVDSNTVVPVSARITNYGTYGETFSVIFRIGTFHSDTKTVMLGAGESTNVNFDSWTITQPRGNYTLKCSTQLSSDANSNNNQQTGSVTVMVHDVGMASFNAPPPEVDSNTTVLVSATIVNYGTYQEFCNVFYRIGDFYSSARSLSLAPGSSQLVVFDDWQIHSPRGTYPKKCSTHICNDCNPGNNQITGQLTVQVHDVGIIEFANLPTTIDSGVSVAIHAQIANFGTYTETFNTQCLIEPNYSSIRNLTLQPGETTLVHFDTWIPLVRSNNLVRCVTLVNDNNSLNNEESVNVFVTVRDIAILSIVAPVETVSLGQNIIPKTLIRNNGNLTATFPVWFKINRGLVPIYLDTLFVNLEPETSLVLEFATWRADSLGIYWIETRSVYSDMDPANDYIFSSTIVKPFVAWFERCPLPIGGGKKVKQGGSLVYVPESTVYALKGSNTNEFYRYDIANDAWTKVCSMPYSTKPKRVKGGAALTYGEGYIYALKGCNTAEFWRYRPGTDSWYEKKPVPTGPKGKKIKSGSGLAFVTKGDTNFVYCLKGSKTNEFYAYWVAADSWLERKPIILAPSGKPIAGGSCMTYDPLTNSIFVLKAKTNEFYIYDITQDSWQVKKPIPLFGTMNKKKKVKDGASLVSDGNGLLYAFKGGNTDEYWAYIIAEDSWITKEPIPIGTNKKRVKAGGSLTIAGNLGRIYAFKGGNTNEFWMYVPLPTLPLNTIQTGDRQEGVMTGNNPTNSLHNILSIFPNPFTKTATVKYELTEATGLVLRLYNTAGELVKTITQTNNAKNGAIRINGENLPAGIYILKLETRAFNLTRKLIISR